ncbi:alpha/beta hydrolase [Nonomuraea africana]|uniref:Pimeloyl-ACP methyl ester carboxylesterase n=1 Tax=Nonomuraea africana TaxID=46171 RepID=A0ABR9KQA1_9ACTN|nr:alpha/beta hydrolase [Nonomuraea africana]MBE1564199.1 pimeloyl-ACP methyl ester carboxylesterase [Nonomuraea africana]
MSLTITACGTDTLSQGFYDQRPAWDDCGDGFECAKLRVPLDYRHPRGEELAISVIRLPATGDRLGSIVINPGGPGGSGIDYGRAARSVLSPQVRDRFDVVAFDPRGVGESAPVECLSDKGLDAFLALDATPDSPAELAALEEGSRRFADGCQAMSPRLLPHIGTANAARDMDVLRAALGDERLTYLGKSYGTYLGAMYADLFPTRVRALVLDGAVDPALNRVELNEGQAEGFSVAFKAYAEHCFAIPDCPLTSRTVDGAVAELTSLLRRTDEEPLRGDGRSVTEALATLGALTPLYDRRTWPVLTEALRQASTGEGELLLHSADQLVGRARDGTYSNQTEANMAVNCVDSPYPGKLSAFATAAKAAERRAPGFGAYVMWGSLPCAFWPVPAAEPNRPLAARGAPPILVVGTTRDPATPYGWARAMAAQLESGVLLTLDGDGHTAYLNGSSCVDGTVDAYLVWGRIPRDGMRCPEIE